jgi:hypothetical protein
VGVRPRLQRDQHGRVHLEHYSIRHQRDICQNIVASIGDPLSLHPDDRRLSSRHLIGDHIFSNNVTHNNISLGLFSRTDQGSRLVGHHLLLQVPDYWAEEGVLDVWGATLPARLSCGEDQSVWISQTHYSGRYGQGPSDSCSGE